MGWRRRYSTTPAMNDRCNINMPKGDYIPDVIFDILLKLPTKSVVRFKITCKTWYSLISDPVFINLHSKQAPQSPKILYSTHGTNSHLQLLDYNNSSFDDCCLFGPINFPYCTYHPQIVGSSCGLVCVATAFDFSRYMYTFCIWNPLTKECRNIPNLSTNTYRYSYFHGLGYDSIGNDFKLVVSIDRIRYNIFSLKEDSWKTITCPVASKYYHPDAIADQLHGIMRWNSLAIVLNGIFHWLVAPRHNDHEIVAFDVGKETFQKLPFPQRKAWNLLEHKGYLCLSFSEEIWLMKVYGVWIHLLTINNSQRFDCFSLPVLCIPTRSEVISHTDETFSWCGGEEEDKLDKIYTRRYGHTLVLYVETLVSPNTVETLVSPNTDDRPQVTDNKMKEKKKLIYQSLLSPGCFALAYLFTLFSASLSR